MKCGCKKDIEAKLLERFKAERPEGEGHSASMDGAYGLGMTNDNKVVQQGVAPVILEVMLPKKSGGMAPKTIKMSMIWTFCPFCGTKAN